MMLVPRRSLKILYAPKKIFYSIKLSFRIRFALVLFVVAILYQAHCTGCSGCRDSVVGMVSIR